MLTKEAKDVLKNLKKLTNNTDCPFGYLNRTSKFCLLGNQDATYDYSAYENEIGSIMDALTEKNYVAKIIDDSHFHLTQKSIHPIQHKLQALGHYIANNLLVFLTFLVSVITLIFTIMSYYKE